MDTLYFDNNLTHNSGSFVVVAQNIIVTKKNLIFDVSGKSGDEHDPKQAVDEEDGHPGKKG